MGTKVIGGIMSTYPDDTSSETRPGNLFGDEFTSNPFPMLAKMHSMPPVIQETIPTRKGLQKAWMVTRLEEAVQVLKRNDLFTVDPSQVGANDYFRRRASRRRSATASLLGQSMMTVDEPDHKRLRGLVSKVFTPKYIQSLRPHIQHIADTLLDRVQDQGHMDLVYDYAYPLPINVIADMLGIPSEDREQVQHFSSWMASGGMDLNEERIGRARAFSEYLVQLVAEKRQHPQDDLISQLILIEEAGDHLDESELLSMIGLLIFTGHETVSSFISTGTLMLLDYPQQLAKLRADVRLIPPAIEELLRFNGPAFMSTARFAAKDVELAGQQIRQGELVLAILTSANHDETQFTQPDELDIVRDVKRHLAFGQGIHICLGAPLARLEGDIAFTTLLQRMPDLRLNVPRESIVWHGVLGLRGLDNLPVAF
jgi:cytochrome P450